MYLCWYLLLELVGLCWNIIQNLSSDFHFDHFSGWQAGVGLLSKAPASGSGESGRAVPDIGRGRIQFQHHVRVHQGV